MATLSGSERPARGEPQGLLVLHHGRGTDERDLLPLAEVIDPGGRLHVVSPRAPLTLEGAPGYHWYRVSEVGRPDPQTFDAAREALAELHDELWRTTGLTPERTVLGGFSMGAVMSYATALDAGRPRPAGLLALSGFLPRVPGWEPDPSGRRGLRALIAHGRLDRIIAVGFGREARDRLLALGLEVDYHESDAGHHIDPRELPAVAQWLADTLP